MSPTVLSQSMRLRGESSANGGTSDSVSLTTASISRQSVAGSQNGQGERSKSLSPRPTMIGSSKSSAHVRKNSENNQTSVKSGTTKRLRSSPFRIKVGCVVAVRYRSGGNRVTLVSPSREGDCNGASTTVQALPVPDRSSLSYSEVWSDPRPGRDEGWALIGRRVRCCFPQSVLSQEFPGGRKPTSRMLEGEIISIVDFPTQVLQTRQSRKRMRPTDTANISHREKRVSFGTLVELLVDEDRLNALPFLKRIDPVVDLSKLSESARRGYVNEERIRGKGKAMVEVLLSDASGVATSSTRADKSEQIVARWVIRKRVPSTLAGPNITSPGGKGKYPITKKEECDNREETTSTSDQMKTAEAVTSNGNDEDGSERKTQKSDSSEIAEPKNNVNVVTAEVTPQKRRRKGNGARREVSGASRYLGDGNDASVQQENNWRWLAARYNSTMLFEGHPMTIDYLEMLSYGLMVGEVTKVEPAPISSSTLAFVTIRRIILPEHTKFGRLPHHNLMDMYDDYDSTITSFAVGGIGTSEDSVPGIKDDSPVHYQFPVEELVIVNRRVKRNLDSSYHQPWVTSKHSSSEDSAHPEISYSYSLTKDTYFPADQVLKVSKSLQTGLNKQQTGKLCHRCRLMVSKLSKVGANNESPSTKRFCKACARALKKASASRKTTDQPLRSICDCLRCEVAVADDLQNAFCSAVSKAEFNSQQQRLLHVEEESESTKAGGGATSFLSTRAMLRSNLGQRIDFCLPTDFSTHSAPSNKPISKVKTKTPKNAKKILSVAPKSSPSTAEKPSNSPKPIRGKLNEPAEDDQASLRRGEELKFAPTSCRLVPYNVKKRKFDASPLELYPWTGSGRGDTDVTQGDKPRNLRLFAENSAGDVEKEGKSTNSRAARANQRRLMRDVAAIGLSFDSLAGREQQLRFDRSGIHAWGVFADDDIREGEMIIEYRGEIIENAVAEKREIEYERAKIGSDYMFRIDDLIVCDATKQGNVARFINASCEPNCHTKIISIDGTKRIAIYAKRDIGAGEELCYDYKFPLEYDESKRIPCLCRARDCRGFMNWVSCRANYEYFHLVSRIVLKIIFFATLI